MPVQQLSPRHSDQQIWELGKALKSAVVQAYQYVQVAKPDSTADYQYVQLNRLSARVTKQAAKSLAVEREWALRKKERALYVTRIVTAVGTSVCGLIAAKVHPLIGAVGAFACLRGYQLAGKTIRGHYNPQIIELDQQLLKAETNQ